MKKFFRLIVSIVVGLFAIGFVQDYIAENWIIFFTGVISTVLTWGFLKSYSDDAATDSVASSDSAPVPVGKGMKEKDRPYKFIFTHEERILDAIEHSVSAHPKVISVGQDTGNWYSNGETGPEWFSMHVRCKVEDAEEVQEFIRQQLKERDYSYQGINFMGSYN